MIHSRLLNAFKKIGATIEPERTTRYKATVGDRVVIWHTQDNETTRGIVVTAYCVHTPHPDTDVMTDYFCDTHYDTIKAATCYLKGE